MTQYCIDKITVACSKLGKASEKNVKKKASSFNSHRYKKLRTTENSEIM
jgi:hypothetical protein